MKILSPSVLMLLGSLAVVQADVTMVAGYVYDVGKGSYSTDGSIADTNDNLLCWAATAANIFQHWQDWYLDWYVHPEEYPDIFPPAPEDTEADTPADTTGYTVTGTIQYTPTRAIRYAADDTPATPGTDSPGTEEPGAETPGAGTTVAIPDGFNDKRYTRPTGTQYLEIYDTFRETFVNNGGLLRWATEWYFNGKKSEILAQDAKDFKIQILKADAGDGGYMPGAVDTYSAVFGWHFTDLAGLKKVLDIPFGYAGIGVYLGIITPGGGGHAISCWGYETDADGTLCALYITDSDDKQYGARRVDVREENGQIRLSSPYKNGSYSSDTYTINEVSFIANNDPIYVKVGNVTLEELPENGEMDKAYDITGRKLSSPAGITTRPESLLAASGGKGTSLTLGGGVEKAEGNGITALAGSMISLNNTAVSVSNFAGDGISVGCEVNLSGGSVSVTGNGGIGIYVGGTAEDPKAFLQMKGNSLVEISGNAAGGLKVARSVAQAMLEGNMRVEISGNTASAGDNGAVVYNAGTLSIAGNGSVTFSDNTAQYDIYNTGSLHLSAGEGQCITFQHGFKNSASGTATLGDKTAGQGTYAFKNGPAAVTMTTGTGSVKKNGGAMMQEVDGKGTLTLGKAGFTGATSFTMEDANLSLSEVAFSGGDVTFNLGYFADMNLLDLSGATFAKGSTVSFILDLGSEAGKKTDFMFFGYPWQDMDESELTEVKITLGDYVTGFQAQNVNLALTVTGTIADDAMLIIDTEGFNLAKADVEVPDCIYRRTADGMLYYGAPEPTTATLSLLALAALCSRRRRK